MWNYTIPAPLPQGWKVAKYNLHSSAPFGIWVSLRLHPKWQPCALFPLSYTAFPYFLTDFFWKQFLNKLFDWILDSESTSGRTLPRILTEMFPSSNTNQSTVFNSTPAHYLPSYYNERSAFVLIKPTYLLIQMLLKNCASVVIVLSPASSMSSSLLAHSHQETYSNILYFEETKIPSS